MVSVPIIVRIIGPDNYGLINYAAAIVSYFILIVNYGFDLTATRQVAQNRENKPYIQELFSTVLWCKILLFLATLLVFSGCFLFFPVFRAEWQVMVYTYVALISWVITPNWIYQGMQELSRIAMFDIIIKILFTISVLLVVRHKSGYVYQPLAAGISQIVIGYYSFHYAMHRYGLKLIRVSFQKIISVLKEERIVFFSSVVINLYTTTNTVILGSMVSIAQVGYYSAALRFIQMAQAVITLPLSNSFFPMWAQPLGEAGKMASMQPVRCCRWLV